MATSPSSMDVWLQDACKQQQLQTPDSQARFPTNWSLPSSSCQKFALLCTYTAKPRSASIEDRCVQTTQMPRLTLAPIKIMDVKDVHALTRIHRSLCFSRSVEAILRRDEDLKSSFFKAIVQTEHWRSRVYCSMKHKKGEKSQRCKWWKRLEDRDQKKKSSDGTPRPRSQAGSCW
jgi:hypothetical protein